MSDGSTLNGKGPVGALEDPGKDAEPSLPSWAAEALGDLARGERELLRIRKCQEKEAEEVNHTVENALVGVQREQRLLLERVEQDHQKAHRRLEELQRENTSATQVGQTQVDQRLNHLSQLKKEICQWGREQIGRHQKHLLRDITELLQPWEMTLSLKRVNFRPSSQPKPITFGEIRVQHYTLAFPVGIQDRPCTLHSEINQGRDADTLEKGQDKSHEEQDENSAIGDDCECTVKKTLLSPQSEDECDLSDEISPTNSNLEERTLEEGQHVINLDVIRKDFGQGTVASCTNEKLFEETDMGRDCAENSVYSSREDLAEHEPSRRASKDLNKEAHKYEVHTQRKVGKSFRETKQEMVMHDSQKTRYHKSSINSSTQGRNYGPLDSSKAAAWELGTTHSCLCLTSNEYPGSCLDLKTARNLERASSPTDSVDSCYTFIVSSPRDYNSPRLRDQRLSQSIADLRGRSRPLIDGRNGSQSGSAKKYLKRQRSEPHKRLSESHHQWQRQQPLQESTLSSDRAGRFLSLSVIDVSANKPRKSGFQQVEDEFLLSEKVEDVQHALRFGRLVRQFGKQGSGRADFKVPSGVHATPQGQLFVVDCGNSRVQVTDSRGNVLQQVCHESSQTFARRCQNYFDIAVSTKGLIALSCAAERALLIFNRHGRHLQTFGGPGMASRDELEAPRGVAVNLSDEFLVADMRRGTIVVLRLDPKKGSRLERRIIPGFHKPYLVAASVSMELVAVSEKGGEMGQAPCVKVLDGNWNVVRILGVCLGVGPILSCPWGVCIDGDGDILVADWAREHRVVIYPAQDVGRLLVSQGLSSPRGLTLLPQGYFVVSDSMHHCIKIFQYK